MNIFDTLTNRQKEVLELICLGFSNEQIVNKLCITKSTLHDYIKVLYEAYDIKNSKSAHRVKLVLKRLEEMNEK